MSLIRSLVPKWLKKLTPEEFNQDLADDAARALVVHRSQAEYHLALVDLCEKRLARLAIETPAKS